MNLMEQASFAEIAQLVEHDLAKVGVARFPLKIFRNIFCPGGGMVDALVSGASVENVWVFESLF